MFAGGLKTFPRLVFVKGKALAVGALQRYKKLILRYKVRSPQ